MAMATPTPDTAVAEAMNRVLDAELAAAAAIAAAQQQAEITLETAREQRRRILDTARQRATRLHSRAESRLAAAVAALAGSMPPAVRSPGSSDALVEQAVRTLARRLTAADHEPT